MLIMGKGNSSLRFVNSGRTFKFDIPKIKGYDQRWTCFDNKASVKQGNDHLVIYYFIKILYLSTKFWILYVDTVKLTFLPTCLDDGQLKWFLELKFSPRTKGNTFWSWKRSVGRRNRLPADPLICTLVVCLDVSIVFPSVCCCLNVYFIADRGMGHSEESRLANLLRRVSREDDRDRRLSTLRQLKEFISHSENKVVSFITLLFLSHNFHNFIKIFYTQYVTLEVNWYIFFFMDPADFFS